MSSIRSRGTERLYRAVQLTARTSAVFFAGAQATSAQGTRGAPASRLLYLAFIAAHAVHFSVVARYAQVNRGRDLFPGGRNMNEVGGWPTVLGIFTSFAGLALTGLVAGAPRPRRAIEHAATGVIAAMFVGVYLGQVGQSRWYAVPAAAAVAAAATANVLAQRRRRR